MATKRKKKNAAKCAKNPRRKKAVKKNAARKRKGGAKWLALPKGAKAVRVRRSGGRLVVEAKR